MTSFPFNLFSGSCLLGLRRGFYIFTTWGPLIAGGSESPEWWGAIGFGAVPEYRLTELPGGKEVSGQRPDFDKWDRLWLGSGVLARFDGNRADTWEQRINRVVGLTHSNRLVVANQNRFGYIQLDASGNPQADTITWINDDFPPGLSRFNLLSVDSFPDEPGMFLAIGSEIWHWHAGTATRLLVEPESNVIFPFEWNDRWHYSISDGLFWELSSTGSTIALELEPELPSIYWARRDSENPTVVEAAGGPFFWRGSDALEQCWTDNAMEHWVEGNWYVGSTAAKTGWVISFSHLGDFLVHPQAERTPVRVPPPHSPEAADQGSQVNTHRFDSQGNLWIESVQGLFRWQSPGLMWRWMPESSRFTRVKRSATGILFSSAAELQHLDFEEHRVTTADLEGEFFFDTLVLPSGRLLYGTRGFIGAAVDGRAQRLSEDVDEDIRFLRPIQDDPAWFVAYGDQSLYLSHLEPDDRIEMEQIIELDKLITDVVADGLRFDAIASDGSIQRVRLLREEEGGYRLGSIHELWKGLGEGGQNLLARWEDHRLCTQGGTAYLVSPDGNAEALRALESFEVLQFAEGEANGVVAMIRKEDAALPIFAFLEGPPSADVDPTFAWLPGSLEVGSVMAFAWDPRHEHFYVGGSQKLLSFHRSSLRSLETLPPVHLEISEDNGVRWQHASRATVELPFKQANLRYRWFNEEWFSYPPLTVETRVEGLGDVWIAAANAERELSGIRAGDFTIEARVVDPFGQVHQNLSLPFTVLPPWWQTLWARAGYALAVALGIFGLFRWYSHRARVQRLYLDSVVQKRTSELEAANAAKAEFVANMSHELRNPMNGVVGITELLGRSSLRDEQSRMVATLRSCSEQLSRMINDVLDFAKIEAGRLALDKRPFNAPAMVAKAIDVTSWDATQSSHTIEQETAGHAPFLVVGDDAKISQVLINFLSNGCKYSDPGRILVRTLYAPALRNRLKLRFEVADEGPGMTAEERARVFERFYRSPTAANSPTRGSGLGLAVCAELAELMGGEIGVSRNDRGGSTFFLELTLPLPENAEHVTRPVDFDTAYMGTVLVVDDMDYNRFVAAGILESLGFTVTSVSDGSEAIASLLTADYDFAFVDYELPDSTGPEILRTVRREKNEFRTKCFAVTAYAGEEKRRECLDAGFLGFVSKPISRLRLREALLSAGLRDEDLAKGSYQQPISDHLGDAYDLEPLLMLSGGSMDKLMAKCEEFLSILKTEVEETKNLLLGENGDPKKIGKRLHRLTSHGSIVKAHRFLDAVEKLRQEVKGGRLEAWPESAEIVEEQQRELAINLRRVVDEYRSRG